MSGRVGRLKVRIEFVKYFGKEHKELYGNFGVKN